MGLMSSHVTHVTRQRMTCVGPKPTNRRISGCYSMQLHLQPGNTHSRVLHPQAVLPGAYFEWKEGLEVVVHFSSVGATPPLAG